MGTTSSQPQRGRKTSSSGSRRQSSDILEVTKKIDEKECVFIAMQAEIDKAITEHNKPAMKSLASEIAAHIMDLNQLKTIEIPSSERGRSQRVVYNFEISLAKLKSILNSDTVAMKRFHQMQSEQTQFYVNDPDIVSDLIRFDNNDSRRSSLNQNRNTLPPLPETEIAPNYSSLNRNNSLNSRQPPDANETFNSIENEFGVLKDQLGRPIEDINEYYQMDKGVFYLQVRLKNTDVPQGSALNDRKFGLLKQLTEFRTLLDQKSGQLEEQREITQEVNTLELLVDSATEKDLDALKSRALLLEETIQKSSWDQNLIGNKIETLRRLARILERIAYSVSPAASLRKSVEHLYGNLSSLQAEMDQFRAQEELESIQSIDKVLEQQPEYTEDSENDDEAIYGNVESIRQHLETTVAPKGQQRGTVYVNADIVRQNSSFDDQYDTSAENMLRYKEPINKPPLPLPRNYDEKIITDLSKHWQRLNEILDSEVITDTDKMEVAEIQKHAEVARNLFERKIKRIMEKFEENIEL